MFAIVLSGALHSVAWADSLIVEGIKPAAQTGQPQRGSTKADVLAQFGEPATQRNAVGDPPISSWEYAPFVVYFEHDYVLHAVAKRQ
jgi:hypothetical protein